MKSSEGICSQLKEQLDRMELKLSREVESRQAAELKCREVELAHRSLTISHQTLQDELSEASSKLQGESHTHTHHRSSMWHTCVYITPSHPNKYPRPHTHILTPPQVRESLRFSRRGSIRNRVDYTRP